MNDFKAQSTVDAEEILESIESCLDEHEYDSAVRIGERYLSKIENDSLQAAYDKFRVSRKIADALFKLNSFHRALDQYEQCLSLAENYVGLESDEAMEINFKIEKTLNNLAILEKISAGEAELKSILLAQYLAQTAEDNKRNIESAERKATPQIETELLENLWADALEKQEKTEQASKRRLKPPDRPGGSKTALIVILLLLALGALYFGSTFMPKVDNKDASTAPTVQAPDENERHDKQHTAKQSRRH